MTYKWEAIAQDLTEERDRLLKENERLRKALETIAELEGDEEGQKFKLTRFQAAQVARAALKSEKQ